jgi:beta-glucanase (GH16 family)
LNLTQAGGDGSCTAPDQGITECSITSNSTSGKIIPPVRSARITTKGKKNIKYGKVEVVAKMPQGDWLWPAIWMMPEQDTYGPWPASGEIDIMESRGNDVSYPAGGRDTYSSAMHWGMFTSQYSFRIYLTLFSLLGPTTMTDMYHISTKSRSIRRSDFSKGFHTFGLEWTENYLTTYMDGQAWQTLYWEFDPKLTMWQRGGFASVTVNQTLLKDPWSQTGRTNTPFDQSFYLILNVAVGGTNGWFPYVSR